MTQNRDASSTSTSDQAQALPTRWLSKLLHNQLTQGLGGFSRKALTYRPAKTLLAYGMSSALIASTLVLGIQQPALAAACSTPDGTGDTFSGGAGTQGDPYKIATATDLIRLSELTISTNADGAAFRSARYIQTENINMAGCNFEPIGMGTQITLHYNGDGYTTSNLTISKSGVQAVGMFSWLQGGGTVRNLGLVSVDVTGGASTGGLVGRFRTFDRNTSRIDSVFITGKVTGSGSNSVGGLVGFLDVFGSSPVELFNSYADVLVANNNSQTGGLVGVRTQVDGTVLIENSYSIGQVTSTTNNIGGGLIGEGALSVLPTVNESFWNTETSLRPTSFAGVGRTIAQMQEIETYSNWDIVAGWEAFDPATNKIWGICSGINGGFPFLLWQFSSDPCPAPVSENPVTSGGGGAVVTITPTPATTAPQRLAPRVALTPPPAVTGPVISGDFVPAPPQAATALIRGIPTTLQQSVPDSTSLSLATGSVALDMTVASGSGARSSDGVTQLGVKNGSSVELAGSGLFPGSSVQVFIPLSAGDSRELARLVVNPDGSFSGAAAFSTDPLAAPLPIGPRLLQLVTIDEDGNQVVLEMTVTIEQSDSNPEFNRELGSIPTMILGSLEATSAGLPIDATITALADQRLAVVEGDGWTMAVNIDSPDGAVEQTEAGALLKLVRDETALVSGSGFMAGTRADVWLFSEPTLVGTVTIDENGDFTGEVTIDPDLIPSGEHTLQLQGVGTDGYVKAANLGVSVEDAGVTASVVPENGFSWNFLWWVLLVAVVGLIVWFMVRRRMAA